MADMLWFRIVCVAVAGALGSLLRWGSYELIYRIAPERFSLVWHVGTLAVNTLGCFAFGLSFELLRHFEISPTSPVRLAILTGFLGAYTTYSTFAFDTFDLQTSGQVARGYLAAAGFVAVQVVAGWLAMLAGITAGRAI